MYDKYLMSEIAVDDSFNCRGKVSKMEIADLAKDIKINGLISPVVLMPIAKEDENDYPGKKFFLIAGFRRFYAHEINDATDILAIVRPDIRDKTHALALNLSENIQRTQLDIMQEATTIERLYDMGLNRTAISKSIGKSSQWVQTRLNIVQLPGELHPFIKDGVFTNSEIHDIHTMYSMSGKSGALRFANEIKDAKFLGKSRPKVMSAVDKEHAHSQKREHSRTEMIALQDKVRVQIGNGIVTRTLAWCIGEISSEEFDDDLEDYAAALGKKYVRSKEN